MAMINVVQRDDFFFFARGQEAALGGLLQQKYQAAEPFPHIVIDDFLPRAFIDAIVAVFPGKERCSIYQTQPHQWLKRGYRPDDLGDDACRHYLYLFNTQPFLSLLEDITGADGLIPDPYFAGGGLHEIERGGKLGVHTDFNYHQKLNLVRCLNVIVFLNEDWQSSYGGHLELWDQNMEQCIKSIEPLYNRCVIFNTNKSSYHGHPSPLNCPEGTTRRSIALYYYLAADKVPLNSETNTRTDWQARPGTDDAVPNAKKSFIRKVFKL